MSACRNMARIMANSSGLVNIESLPSIPASRISGAVDYARFPAGATLQVQSSLFTSYNTCTVALGSWTTVPNMSVSITPKRSNSKFRIDIRWGGETIDGWDNVFAISRNGTIINLPTQEGSRMGSIGMPLQTYIDGDNSSTLEYSCFSTIDVPNTTSTITYSMVGQAWTSRTLYTGCVVSYTTDAANYERISNEIIVTEIAV